MNLGVFLLRYVTVWIGVTRKPVDGVCNQVRNKPGCAAKEVEKGLGISDLGSIGIVLPM